MRMDRFSKFTAGDQFMSFQVMRPKTKTMSDHELASGVGCSGFHRLAFVEAERHRFFADDMFARAQRRNRQWGVPWRGHANVDDLDFWIGDEILRALEQSESAHVDPF